MSSTECLWAYEGPINRNGKRDCLDFRANTMATSEIEARRNIVWQYKVKFSLKKNENIELDGIIYKVPERSNVATKKKKIEYDYEQLEINL